MIFVSFLSLLLCNLQLLRVVNSAPKVYLESTHFSPSLLLPQWAKEWPLDWTLSSLSAIHSYVAARYSLKSQN